jgi:hypothetical protein
MEWKMTITVAAVLSFLIVVALFIVIVPGLALLWLGMVVDAVAVLIYDLFTKKDDPTSKE